MNYEEVKDHTGAVTALKKVDGDGAVSYIPVDPGNRDYLEFLEWQSVGGVVSTFTASQPLGLSHEQTVIIACGSRLADIFQGNRSSLNSYALRILATSNQTEDMKTDLATFKALDLWEEAMLAARDAAIATASEPSWPDPPPGGIELVMACR